MAKPKRVIIQQCPSFTLRLTRTRHRAFMRTMREVASEALSKDGK